MWDEIIRLLDDPALIRSEIDRRRQAAFETNPSRKREEELRREQARLEKNIERIISAYQEALVTLPQLRQRMPELHRQIHAVEAELHSLETAAVDDARYLQLAETLSTFRGKLRARAETLDVGQRQQILRLLVKEILVGSDTITIRHSLPIGPSGSGPAGMTPPDSGMIATSSGTGYLLRTGSRDTSPWEWREAGFANFQAGTDPIRRYCCCCVVDDSLVTDFSDPSGLDLTSTLRELLLDSVEEVGAAAAGAGAASVVAGGACWQPVSVRPSAARAKTTRNLQK